MDPHLLTPSPAADFNFDSTSTSPYATAPSSPKILFPKFFNTTTTTTFHDHSPINHFTTDDLRSTEPFETSLVTHDPQKNDAVDHYDQDNMDFAFDFSGQLEPPSISDADELFIAGKIKPLKPVPVNETVTLTSSTIVLKKKIVQRGRVRTPPLPERSSRSLSPVRISVDDQKQVTTIQSSSLFGFSWYNKWNLKNLLLFRSTSEGSAVITKDVKNTSFRSRDGGGGGSVGGSSRKMKRKLSAHEIHYTANRAVSEKMRRKTFLPYKSGLLGCCCLGFCSHGFDDGSRRR